MIKYDNSASLCKFLPRFLLHSRNVWNELWWLCLTHYHCHRNLNCFILWMHFDQSLPIMMKMLQLFSFRNFWKRANLLLSCFPLSEVPKPTNYLLFCRPTNPSFTTHRSQNLWELLSSIPHGRTFVCICCLQIFQQIIVAGSSNVSLCLTIRPRMSQCQKQYNARCHNVTKQYNAQCHKTIQCTMSQNNTIQYTMSQCHKTIQYTMSRCLPTDT